MPDNRSATSSIQIRDATPVDARSIAAVASSVWPDERFDPVAISRLMTDTDRGTLVADLNWQVVGFVDGFITRSATGELRWEVDLLAVSPAVQGRGVGRTLVRVSVEHGINAGATSARGLIRAGNVASERVFEAVGFAPSPETFVLWTSDRHAVPSGPSTMHVVPVSTFRYDGAWLENVTPAALATLRSGATLLGALIPAEDSTTIAAAEAAGFVLDGHFRVWRRRLP